MKRIISHSVCIAMIVCLTFALSSCSLNCKRGEHTYDNACDAVCNVCDEIREVNHTDADGDNVCDVCTLPLNTNVEEDEGKSYR